MTGGQRADGGVPELGANSWDNNPAQTAAMETAWYLGQLPPQEEAHAPGLSEARMQNRCTALVEETAHEPPTPPVPPYQEGGCQPASTRLVRSTTDP